MYNHILVPMDLEHLDMFPKAIALAKQLLGDDRGKIHCVYVDTTRVHSSTFQLATERAKEMRVATKQRVHDEFEQQVPEHLRGSCHIRNGVVYDEILEEEKKVQPDVIIIAAGKPGLSSYLLGSNAEKVLRHAKGSVFVIRDNKHW